MPRQSKKSLEKLAAHEILADYLPKLGARGGNRRAKNLTFDERSASARRASRARWAKVRRSD